MVVLLAGRKCFSRGKEGLVFILLATTLCAEAAERPSSDAQATSLFWNIEFSWYIFSNSHSFCFIVFFNFVLGKGKRHWTVSGNEKPIDCNIR